MSPDDGGLTAAFELLADALEMPADQREAFVVQRTTGDHRLRSEVLSLLRVGQAASDGGRLSDTAIDAKRGQLDALLDGRAADLPVSTRDPDFIGDYRIIRRIGSGGMGIVYEAEQRRPRRRVALKVVDGIRAGTEYAARLRTEAEIQGRLQHQAIAQIYEAGVASVGLSACPFFAMELIDGRPILAHAEEAHLELRDRLSLLLLVAEGVGYAHRHAVIHRDLKPDNVLVTRSGQPKVVDFGIARVTGDSTFAATMMTRDGHILGTLAYMAPEQLGGREEITPRADVYALGVMAYELLSGRLPIELGGLSISAAIRQIEISEAPPLRRVAPVIPRDVETIIGTCLRRDPSGRYTDADALAADIGRFLDERPVRARPPSAVDHAAKFAKRHRALVGGVAATITVLLIGLLVAVHLGVGQYRARLAAEASDLEARRQQALLASRTFQLAADEAAAGDVLGAIESLEKIPPALRGWGWGLLAASVPEWMPGSGDFGGTAFNLDAGTAWTGNRNFAVVNDGRQLLTIVDGALVIWDPRTGALRARPELGRFTRVEQVPLSRRPLVMVYGTDAVPSVLDTRRWEILPVPDYAGTMPGVWRVEPASGAFLWQERDAGGDGRTAGGGVSTFVVTRSHGVQRVELGSDADSDLPGWVDVRGLDDQAVISLYRESEQPHWFRFALLDAASGRIVARSARVARNMSFTVLEDRQEIAAAGMTHPDREPAGSVVVLDTGTLEIKRRLDGIAQPLAYLPDRDRVVVRLEDGSYRLMEPDAGQLDDALLLDHGSPYPIIASNGVMHGGTSVVAITPRPYRPIVIDASDPQTGLRPLYHARPLPGALYHLAISPGGGLLATMSPWQDDVALLDALTGETLAMLPMGSGQGHRWHAMLWFSPDGGELLATVHARDDSVVGVTAWDLADGSSRWTAPDDPAPHNFTVPPLDARTLTAGGLISSRHAVTPDGNALVFTGSGENTIKRLDLASHTFEVMAIGTAEGIAFSPDGRHLAAVATLGARVIDFESGEVIARPISDPDRLLCAAYSPDGSTLAVGSLDGRIFVVETEFYTLLYAFDATPAEDGRGPLFVHDLRWSPDGRTLYAAHAGGVLTAWDARRPWERREQRTRWLKADEAMAAEIGSGRFDPSWLGTSSEERAAAEVALVKRWGTREAGTGAPSSPPPP